MSFGSGEFPPLTRAQRKVLADLLLFRNSRNETELSYRQLAETTGLSRMTVWFSVDRLNELKLVRTVAVGRAQPAKHQILGRVLVQLEPVQSTLAARECRS